MFSERMIFWMALTFRLLCCLLVQTSFVPDEYWQSLEPAHRLVFGYGYLTWEWIRAIRSYLYPLCFAIVYWLLAVLRLDSTYAVIIAPRLLQSLLSAITDVFLYKLTKKLYGERVALWTLICYAVNWFSIYCGARTLSNCMETTLTVIGLYLYPWPSSMLYHDTRRSNSYWQYLCLGTVSTFIRPTSALWWLPLCAIHFITATQKFRLFVRASVIVLLVSLSCIFVDRLCYGRWMFTVWNFAQFNFFSNSSSFFGSHPWHWYFTQGLPAVCLLHLIPISYGIWKSRRFEILALCVWYIAVHSILAHKEFRFLHPTLPLLCIYAGLCFNTFCKPYGKGKTEKARKLVEATFAEYRRLIPPSVKVWFLVLAGCNLLLIMFVGLIHQRGALDVMRYLHRNVRQKPLDSNVWFLMPCHSTPFYSHLHVNVSMRFLTCEPNFHNVSNYVDEADVFHADPASWLQTNLVSLQASARPSHIVAYDWLSQNFKQTFLTLNYDVCETFRHSPVFERPRQSAYIVVLCKR